MATKPPPMKRLTCSLAAWLLLTGASYALTEAQLKPLCAPYALYPDSLLAEVLTAATHPDQLMAAYVWTQSNQGVTGDALTTALASQTWDPSVKALAGFPDVLKKMTGDLNDTTSLGQAFATDQADVMECVQDLRATAQTLGALATTPQQTVVTQGSNIVIQPTNPDVVYVPEYNDDDLLAGTGLGLLGFGAGVALGGWYNNNYGAFDWANHYVYTGAGVRDAYYGGGMYGGLNSWHAGTTDVYHGAFGGTGVYHSGATVGPYGGVHTGTTAAYRAPDGNIDTFHTGADGYRGYGGFSDSFHTDTAFDGGYHGFGDGGWDSRAAGRGWGSMGGGFGHFGGGFRR